MFLPLFKVEFSFVNLFLLELLTRRDEACYGSNKNERGALSNE